MMKLSVFIFLISFSLLSCNQSTSKENVESKEYQILEGEFIYLSDAAVLKGNSFIYGVTLDDKMQELATIVKPLQRDEFDMVPVLIKGEVKAKPEGQEGWDEIVTIKEILEVKAPKGEATIKLEAGEQLKTEGASLKVESDQ